MNRGDAEDAEKAITACFRDQPVASNPYLPTIQLRLFMDSGLFWSALAKRRGRIEPQRWGISGVCREPGRRLPLAPRRRRFPLTARPWFGTGESPNPKQRRASSPWPTPRRPRVPRIPVGTGVKLPPHSKMSGVSFHHREQSGIHKEPQLKISHRKYSAYSASPRFKLPNQLLYIYLSFGCPGRYI